MADTLEHIESRLHSYRYEREAEPRRACRRACGEMIYRARLMAHGDGREWTLELVSIPDNHDNSYLLI
jgi:hypothetical protein